MASEAVMPSVEKLAKQGDICSSCRPFWENQKRPPRRLVAVPGKFTDYGIPIVICPYCDGTPILRMNGT